GYIIMSGLLGNLLQTILQNLIWLVIGLGAAATFNLARVVWPLHRLWRLADPKSVAICTANSTMTDTGAYVRPATGIGQVQALALVASSLSRAYRKLHFRYTFFSTDSVQERYESDLILLGGMKNNQVTARYLDLVGDRQPLQQHNNTIIWRQQGPSGKGWKDGASEEFTGEIHDGVVVVDYGYAFRTQNPFTHRPRTAVVLAGCHTYGVTAAARYFTEQLSQDLRWRLFKRNIVVLIRADVVNGFPTNVSIVRWYAW
ncbi:MAG TPA: hypothetical protein VFX24_09945, partial [Ktedonobacterales bacterium]|nr:hypothetical protein [Ktedonobacterales bacterium]